MQDGLEETAISQMADAFTSGYNKFKDKKGISMNTTKKDKWIQFSLIADFDKMDSATKDEFDLAGKSETYEQAKQQFEKDGYTCK